MAVIPIPVFLSEPVRTAESGKTYPAIRITWQNSRKGENKKNSL